MNFELIGVIKWIKLGIIIFLAVIVIVFLRWSTRNQARGIVYSIDGSIPDESMFECLIHIEPMSEDRWYFYISDYKEWMRRNS
ncbi:MAG: hypothetical protein LBC73_05250 [Oscillospiraceae bacterium]|jgi:hypothetical protein|nr:hypothetical protein [Oscillospiraceae bacterium]